MNDPLSSLSAPPPRYLLESDSSDEEGQGAYPGGNLGIGPSKPKIRLQNDVQVHFTGLDDQLDEVIIGLGQSGKFILRTINGQQVGEARIGGKSVGKIVQSGNNSTVVSLDEGDFAGEESWEITKTLINKVKAKKWTIITSYVPSMYIPSPAERASTLSEPPTRILTAGSSQQNLSGSIRGFEAPNYLTGVAGALVSLASHPTSSIPQPTTVLLPLPLSSLAISRVQSTLKAFDSLLVQRIGESSKRWSEDDDEPYSARGMGRVKGQRKAVGEISSMYT
ncbi:uncharacterized protein IL334_007293 [Kwoniella shivajii]|uniref:Uncharacterized protein n=1 Tax=Kwoniella shivajii TaxID=564305 RepID=A0ABZ1DAE4_9TREE|nr:hypothetical protein IL334_007293 [Kwoniella shivajii]